MADIRSPIVGYDLDSGAGVHLVQGVSLRLSASGGSIEALGQQVMASSIPVVLASNQSAVAVDTELMAAAALADAASATPTTPTVGAVPLLMNASTIDRARAVVAALDSVGTGIAASGMVGQFDDTSTAAVTENQFAPVRISTRRALLVEGVASGANLNVNLAASAATVTVDSELPAAAALADAEANPTVPGIGSHLLGYNGTTWDRVRTANTGRLQVDVVTGGGATAPVNPVISYQTSASLAAGSSVALTTAEAASKKLRQVIVWASVAFKATLATVDNAVESAVKGVTGGPAFVPALFPLPHQNYLTLGATAGLDAFRVNVTNLDDSNAADVYATFFMED